MGFPAEPQNSLSVGCDDGCSGRVQVSQQFPTRGGVSYFFRCAAPLWFCQKLSRWTRLLTESGFPDLRACMRIGLVASPFIPVPPTRDGGTELFVANLAETLRRLNVNVSVYANGESTVNADVRWVYPKQDWPLSAEMPSSGWSESRGTAAENLASKTARMIQNDPISGCIKGCLFQWHPFSDPLSVCSD